MLNEVDPTVIIRVVGEINSANDEEQDLEAVEKTNGRSRPNVCLPLGQRPGSHIRAGV